MATFAVLLLAASAMAIVIAEVCVARDDFIISQGRLREARLDLQHCRATNTGQAKKWQEAGEHDYRRVLELQNLVKAIVPDQSRPFEKPPFVIKHLLRPELGVNMWASDRAKFEYEIRELEVFYASLERHHLDRNLFFRLCSDNRNACFAVDLRLIGNLDLLGIVHNQVAKGLIRAIDRADHVK